MASVNYLKLKNNATIKATMRHCDASERLKHKHSNKEINLSETHKNINFMTIDYKKSCELYDNRIKELDNSTNRNKRSDRVSLFGLEVPTPPDLSEADSKAFFAEVIKLIGAKYGLENIVQANAHYDEIHTYLDGGELKTSRPHLHCFVVPVDQNGQLNGKWFSSKKNMIQLNKEIDAMCQERFNCKFMTNEKSRKLSVEELKQLSNDSIKSREKLVSSLEQKSNDLQNSLLDAQRDLNKLKGNILTEEQIKAQSVSRTLFNKDMVKVRYEDYQALKRTAERVKGIDARERKLEQRERAFDDKAKEYEERIDDIVAQVIDKKVTKSFDNMIKDVSYEDKYKQAIDFIRQQNLLTQFNKQLSEMRDYSISKAKSDVERIFNSSLDER